MRFTFQCTNLAFWRPEWVHRVPLRLVVILILCNNVSAFKRTNSDLWKVPRSIFTTIWMFFSKWWFRTIFQIFEYFPDFPLKRVRHTQFTFGWDFWLQMLPKNFLWGLETCLKYVTTSPDLGLSNGTKIVAFGALEKIRHPYLKKRRPHLAFESYFSNCNIGQKGCTTTPKIIRTWSSQ